MSELQSDPADLNGPREEAAEEAFCEFLRVRTTGNADFDRFCQKYPELEDELRALHGEWRRVTDLLERLGGSVSISERLKSRFGEIDPGISLHEDAPAEATYSGRLLDKLAAKRPASTRYDIRSELGRGGMGVVYKVWDEDLRRMLAMKVVLGKRDPEAKTTQIQVEPRRMSRFLEEAQITGQLDHPGILPIHELGLDADGRVYFTMRLVEGSELREIFSLARRKRDGWTRTRVLGILLRVCEAMAFAHSKGVIHRDLKPANIMVGRFGATYVMDWGLAKVLGREDSHDIRLRTEAELAGDASRDPDSSEAAVATDRSESDSAVDAALVTMDGDIVGTPAYMSPEQATGRMEDVGPRSDVYSLGAMLYELLTGQMPYEPLGERVPAHTILNAVRTSPPWPVLDIVPDTPGELVAICEKAMARSQDERYQDMSDFAEDLRAYLEGHVVRAYQTGVVAELRKWIERNKAAAMTATALVLVLVGSIAGFIWQQQSTVRALETEQAATKEARDDAVLNLEEALAQKQRADRALRDAEDSQAEATRQRNHAQRNAAQAQLQSRAAERKSYLAHLIAASYSLRLGEVLEAKRSIAQCEHSMRGWEWEHLNTSTDTAVAVFPEHTGGAHFSGFTSSGRVVSTGNDFKVRLIDPETGSIERFYQARTAPNMSTAERNDAAALHPSRRYLATAISTNVISVWDLETPPANPFDPRETWVLGTTGEKVKRIFSLAFSADGRYLAAGYEDNVVRVYEFGTGRELVLLDGPFGPVVAVAFCPTDSSLLVCGSRDSSARVYDWQSDEQTLLFTKHTRSVRGVDWSPDGTQIATASSDGSLALWDATTGELEFSIEKHLSALTSVAYAPAGARTLVATGSEDSTVRLFDSKTSDQVEVFGGHDGGVTGVAFDPTGARVVSSSRDESVRLWTLQDSTGVSTVPLRDRREYLQPSQARFSPSGDRVLACFDYAADGGNDPQQFDRSELVVWDRATDEELLVLDPGRAFRDVAFVGEDTLASVTKRIREGTGMFPSTEFEAELELWDLRTGASLRRLETGHEREVYALAASPDGTRLATASRDRTIHVIDVETGTIVQRLVGHRRAVFCVEFSRDGKLLASGSRDRTAIVWDLETGEALHTLTGHTWQINEVRFDASGTRLATGSNDRTVRVYDLDSGELEHVLSDEHELTVQDLDFSPDGRRIVTASADGFVGVWDAESGDFLLRLRGHSGPVFSAEFAPDGRTIATIGTDDTLRLWESESAAGRHERRRAARGR